ncbi:hypothetical protein JCM16303_002427 [Sporobolomyces ruberrimus]
MTEPPKPQETQWEPPTPNSSQIGFHSPNLPCDHLVLLPPPIVSTTQTDARRSSTSSNGSQVHPFYPSHLLPPLQLPDASLSTSRSHEPTSSSSSIAREMTTARNWEEEYTQRPRRSAAIVAARNIPRQPSPLELDSDDGTFSPPPLVAAPSTSTSTGGGAGGGTTKRKVSHSLIERRRREKINDCLATLKDTVPNLKEEGEKKIAKAKERGRKRGRGDEAGERGGLHKLEILQGTIEYIEALRARIIELENSRSRSSSHERSRQSSPSVSPSSHSTVSPGSEALRPPPLVSANSFTSSSTTNSSPTSQGTREPVSLSKEEADHAANMLLYFSTSPELRPVQM